MARFARRSLHTSLLPDTQLRTRTKSAQNIAPRTGESRAKVPEARYLTSVRVNMQADNADNRTSPSTYSLCKALHQRMRRPPLCVAIKTRQKEARVQRHRGELPRRSNAPPGCLRCPGSTDEKKRYPTWFDEIRIHNAACPQQLSAVQLKISGSRYFPPKSARGHREETLRSGRRPTSRKRRDDGGDCALEAFALPKVAAAVRRAAQNVVPHRLPGHLPFTGNRTEQITQRNGL